MNDPTHHCHQVYRDTVLGGEGVITDEFGFLVTSAISPHCELLEPFCESISKGGGLDSSVEKVGSWTLQEELGFNGLVTGP